ncbi:DUF2187 domain-containing protein [Vagococcus zengguangii]|uniref:DUF2187 domain-containing protein n=1 Tax=Vagococcus zengguangii TaxID=2571750 RepID=A0A4D7CR93_9ENTE|nr:DUF2187 domain-containing protein [Vagococcus zengguangii]QCI86579.1 DUF2187 domain-containing protein [Vagococcus zengguangii]TLG81172.1 DUF2187 domain-containing protein [Vagococcus zengguangii]
MGIVEIGQVVEFTSELLSGKAKGMVETLYDNSCIVSIQAFDEKDDAKVHELINRMVVSYRDIAVNTAEVAVVA